MKKVFIVSCLLALLTGFSTRAQQFWIVGGQYAAEGQFPWVGDMRVFSNHLCGSALIDPYWVLTAGHCAFDPFSMTPMDTAGLRFRFNTVRTQASLNPSGGAESGAQRIFIHPLFNINSPDFSEGNDLTLVRLATPVNGIEPVPLPLQSDTAIVYATGQPVRIAGWGIADTATFWSPDTLKFCNTRVYDFSVCNTLYGGVSTRSFCAGYKWNETESGAAAGDSGGPVWIGSGGGKKLIGVVSGGMLPYTAPDMPGVFTKVAAYRAWIDSVINANGGYTTGIPAPHEEEEIKIGNAPQGLKLFFGAIAAKQIEYSIYNAAGAKILARTISRPAYTTHAVDMQAQASGVYIIRFYNPESGRSTSMKFVKNY